MKGSKTANDGSSVEAVVPQLKKQKQNKRTNVSKRGPTTKYKGEMV